MNIFIWLLIGGLAGGLASLAMGRQGLLLNAGVGMAGAVLGGWLFSGFPGGAIGPADFGVAGLLVSLVGATLVLLVMRLARVTG